MALVSLCITTSASAQSAAAGRIAYLEARFEESAVTFEQIVANPDASRADLALAHRYLAALAAATGELDAARAHVRIAAFLDPDASLPEGAPPELQATVDEIVARGMVAEVSLLVRTGADGSLRVTARSPAGPEGATHALSLRCGERESEVEVVPEESASVTLASVLPGRCSAALHAPSGAVLARAAQDVRAMRVPTATVNRRAWPWAVGIGAALLVVGGGLAVILLTRDGNDSVRFDPPVIMDW